jgi:hypothetical protein
VSSPRPGGRFVVSYWQLINTPPLNEEHRLVFILRDVTAA